MWASAPFRILGAPNLDSLKISTSRASTKYFLEILEAEAETDQKILCGFSVQKVIVCMGLEVSSRIVILYVSCSVLDMLSYF